MFLGWIRTQLRSEIRFRELALKEKRIEAEQEQRRELRKMELELKTIEGREEAKETGRVPPRADEAGVGNKAIRVRRSKGWMV